MFKAKKFNATADSNRRNKAAWIFGSPAYFDLVYQEVREQLTNNKQTSAIVQPFPNAVVPEEEDRIHVQRHLSRLKKHFPELKSARLCKNGNVIFDTKESGVGNLLSQCVVYPMKEEKRFWGKVKYY